MDLIRQPSACFVNTIDSAPFESIALPLNVPFVVLVPTVQALDPSMAI
jgi:hypothetical protein